MEPYVYRHGQLPGVSHAKWDPGQPPSAVAIADRVGHESIEITYRYAHLFPSKQAEMANKLGELKKGGDIYVS